MATTLIIVILLFYIGMMAFAWLFANSMIFQPPPPSYQDGNQIIKLNTGNTEISAIHLPNANAEYTILYSHGNAVDLGRLMPILQQIHAAGFSVFAYDYSGYGTSTGTPSELQTYKDINAAYQHIIKQLQIKPQKIIALGQSLGGAVAVDLASREPLGGLVLESSFVSAYRVMTRISLLPFDQFETLDKLEEIDCPILLIHGEQDRVIPFWHGETLFEKASGPKQHYWVEGAGHNNLLDVAGLKYQEALQNFAKAIRKK